MDFSDALFELKQQKRLSRSTWNADDQFVVHQKGYPEGIGINKNTSDATGIAEGTVCIFEGYFMLFNSEEHFVPWVPSTGDLLADDWYILD